MCGEMGSLEQAPKNGMEFPAWQHRPPVGRGPNRFAGVKVKVWNPGNFRVFFGDEELPSYLGLKNQPL